MCVTYLSTHAFEKNLRPSTYVNERGEIDYARGQTFKSKNISLHTACCRFKDEVIFFHNDNMCHDLRSKLLNKTIDRFSDPLELNVL